VEPDDRVGEAWTDFADLKENFFKQLGGGLKQEDAFAYAVCAIRETFEEAGVLLADKRDSIREGLQRLSERRMGEGLPQGWFREWAGIEGWPLAFSRLSRWAHWITPRLMRSHFDTRFFVAFMPSDQACLPDDRETVHGIWISPEKGLEENHRGEILLSPPTLVTLHELLAYKNLPDLKKEVKTRPWGDARFPRLVPLTEGALILQPWDPMRYGEAKVETKVLEKMILPVGVPFSRLWLHEGVWRPVGL
jgi:8-oxo-dGTP pyrophosphatase MutT (NUDIX family)